MKAARPVAFVERAMEQSADRPASRPIHGGAWIAAWLVTVAASVGLCMVAHRVPYFASDVAITRYVQALDLRALAALFAALNALGFPPVVDIIYGGTLLGIYLAGKRWEAIAGLCGVCVSAGVNALSKELVQRPRPDTSLVHVDHHVPNPSFPAGHVLDFTMFAGYLCFLLALYCRPTPWRHALMAVLVLLMAAMGLARIHSGEHWASDVLGGYVIGGALLASTVLFFDWGRKQAEDRARADPATAAP